MTSDQLDDIDKPAMLSVAARIVGCYVSNNTVTPADIPLLLSTVHTALLSLSGDAEPVQPKPAVSVRQSIKPDYIICLEDGRKLTMLKRHLATAYGMTPDEYRQRWGLRPDYPMVAPNYSKKRSELAKKIGLGNKK